LQAIDIHKDFSLNGQPFSSESKLMAFVQDSLPSHYEFVKELFNPNDYIIAQTSGSTGKPKSIKIQKHFLVNSAQNTINYFSLLPKTKALLNLSSTFIAGKMMWVRALTGGWHLDVISPENKAIALQLQEKRYDFGAMVPLQVYRNIEHIHQVDKLIIGGGNVSVVLQKKLSKLPTKCYATYGMTETVTHIAVKPLNHFKENHKNEFRVFDGINIKTDDRNCLIIDAPSVAKNKVVTNDLVKITSQNSFVWLGRYDNIINSGAVKVIPEQVEAKLAPYINSRFFIAGLADDQLGNKIVLLIEGDKENINLPDFDKILSKYEVPKSVIFVSRFLETKSGKINRNQTMNAVISAK
jgi:O-succinylbenzoic acid--CoA ligase